MNNLARNDIQTIVKPAAKIGAVRLAQEQSQTQDLTAKAENIMAAVHLITPQIGAEKGFGITNASSSPTTAPIQTEKLELGPTRNNKFSVSAPKLTH